jgi:hypothetical protein
MSCTSCGQMLHGKPKINVEGTIYCYRCSKKEVMERRLAQARIADVKHTQEINVYNLAKVKLDEALKAWRAKQREFIDTDLPGWRTAIAVATISYIIANDLQKGLGLLGVILGLIVLLVVFLRISNRRDSEFRSLYPQPTSDLPYPLRQTLIPVRHSPHAHDGSTLQSVNYRPEILARDSLICQACGQKKQRKNLEVHHITPRASGGSDDPTNLVTLCRQCHDREDWYDHVRAYPTTFKNTKRWRRKRGSKIEP